MVWLRNNKNNIFYYAILSGGMRGRYTIIHCQMHLKEFSIGGHLCTNIVMLGISFSFSLKILCAHSFALETETDRGFMVIIIVIRVFPSLFYHCKMKLMFSADKKTLVFTITLYIKAVINIEYNCPLNLNKGGVPNLPTHGFG